jgi:hypothetical protein
MHAGRQDGNFSFFILISIEKIAIADTAHPEGIMCTIPTRDLLRRATIDPRRWHLLGSGCISRFGVLTGVARRERRQGEARARARERNKKGVLMGNPGAGEGEETSAFPLWNTGIDIETVQWSDFLMWLEDICRTNGWHIEYGDETDEAVAIFATER